MSVLGKHPRSFLLLPSETTELLFLLLLFLLLPTPSPLGLLWDPKPFSSREISHPFPIAREMRQEAHRTSVSALDTILSPVLDPSPLSPRPSLTCPGAAESQPMGKSALGSSHQEFGEMWGRKAPTSGRKGGPFWGVSLRITQAKPQPRWRCLHQTEN